MYGKWKEAEINYAKFLIYSYHDGCLPKDLIIMTYENRMLSFLTNLLGCSRMRIVKKFSGHLKYIGKMKYNHVNDPSESQLIRYKYLYERFHLMHIIRSNNFIKKEPINNLHDESISYIPIQEYIDYAVIEKDWWNSVY